MKRWLIVALMGLTALLCGAAELPFRGGYDWQDARNEAPGIMLKTFKLESPRKLVIYAAKVDLSNPKVYLVVNSKTPEWGEFMPYPANRVIETKRIYSVGGGSIVRKQPDGSVTVGPDSVGYKITSEALIFGGNTITATDIAVKLGMAELGDASNVADLDNDFAQAAMAVIREMVEESIDSLKISNDDVDVILVGGGSIVLPKDLAGTSHVFNPDHFGCANAIGSAISKVSGNYEQLIDYNQIPRDQALEQAKADAIKLAVAAGAIEETVEIIEVEDVPLAYCPGNTSRVRVKAAGDLA